MITSFSVYHICSFFGGYMLFTICLLIQKPWRRACAPDSRHGFLSVSYFMPATMLYCRIRGVEVWNNNGVEREIGSRAFRLLLYRIQFLHSILFCEPAELSKRGAEVWVVVKVEREIGTGSLPACLLKSVPGMS